MEWVAEELLDELRNLIGELGHDGGMISPAVYDTAQVLRLYPPKEGVEPGLRWLLAQQEADGGWGNPSMPSARDVPTLAAVLALHTYRQVVPPKTAVEAGLEFLWAQARQWAPPLADDIPVGVELILPRLVHEARQVGLAIAAQPYQALVELGDRKHRLIAKLPVCPGTPFAFSFEAWGTQPVKAMLDRLGSVGNSPSATAAWLSLAGGRPELADEIRRAECYLNRANVATGGRIPGLSPTAWPINRFEQSFALYTLHMAGLLNIPSLFDTVALQALDLSSAVGPDGLGFNDIFESDGDDTAAALAVLHSMGFNQDTDVLLRFQTGTYFRTYHSEFQPSMSVTARAVDALATCALDVRPWQRFLTQAQMPEGYWLGDKWNVSWLHTTCLVLHALRGAAYHESKQAAFSYLHKCQHRDGGWGIGNKSTPVETALGILSMLTLREDGLHNDTLEADTARAFKWLLARRPSRRASYDELWLNKQLYCPPRVDQVFILSALAKAALVSHHHEIAEQHHHAGAYAIQRAREPLAVF